jgi:hypothetical protein
LSSSLGSPSSFPHYSNIINKIFTTPSDIAVLGNRSVWITEHGTSFLTQYNLISHKITRFPTSSNPHQYITLPYWIASSESDDQKSLWFNGHSGNRISLFNTTDMTLTEYEVPTRDPSNGYLANALTLAIDPSDNNKVWFTEFNHVKISVVDHIIPISFDIHAITAKNNTNNTTSKVVALSPRNSQIQQRIAKINLEITKDTGNDIKNISNALNRDLISVNTTSSMTPLARFANMTASFSPTDTVDLTKIIKNGNAHSQQEELTLQSSPQTPSGNYTLGIHATDGTVTKSIFLNMLVKK